MENNGNYLPGKLYLTFGGAEGLKFEPMSLVENDLIAQNLLAGVVRNVSFKIDVKDKVLVFLFKIGFEE